MDATVAGGFVAAATVEAVVLHHGVPGLVALGCGGAPVLAVLAWRRTRPSAAVLVIAGFAVLGTVLQLTVWPDETDSGGVWMFALMFACYSLGAHAQGRRLLLGLLAPMAVVVTANVPTMSGWEMVNGIVFVTVFVGVLPTAVGAVVRQRRLVLDEVAAQRARLVERLREESATAVLDERLRTTERLRPVLLDGLRDLAGRADSTAPVASIESAARELLGQTRREVLALTAPVHEPAAPAPVSDRQAHLTALRAAAQPWGVVAAGALGTGLALECLEALPLDVADWVAVPAAFLVAAPVALLCWRPLLAVVLAWVVATVFSMTVTSLDGTLSGSALALVLAFAVAAISSRRVAAVGLVVCWVGAGIRSEDPPGVAAILLAAWLGGLAVNEVSDLVEQSREANRQLALHAEADARRAVVDERLRFARELHDVLGHSLTVVALQAGAARRLEGTDPAKAAEVRRTLAAAARDGLSAIEQRPIDGAVDGTVAVPAAGPVDGTVDGRVDRTVGGQPDPAGLQALLQRTRSAGLTIDAEIADLAGLDATTLRVTERLVQEALTNVLRHAPGARARVTVRRSTAGVDVVVGNSAATAPGTGPGSHRGLAGIRERVTALAGTVTWGPSDDGGFTVRAHLPVTTEASNQTAKVG